MTAIEALRTDPLHMLNAMNLPGLATFPSLHTVAGLIIVHCCRGIRLIFPLAMAYCAAMVASTPVNGGHYFVDVIAGFALTVVVVMAYRRAQPQ